LTSIHQQIDHKIRIEGSRRSQELKPVCTKSAGEPILDAHFQPPIAFTEVLIVKAFVSSGYESFRMTSVGFENRKLFSA